MLNFLLGSDVAWSKLVRKVHVGSLMYKECKNIIYLTVKWATEQNTICGAKLTIGHTFGTKGLDIFNCNKTFTCPKVYILNNECIL
jgi:hypothetical protein